MHMDASNTNTNPQQERVVLTSELKALLKETAATLKGSDRRRFMAKTVRILGRGGQRKAARELGWDRTTIRKGDHELHHGALHDQYSKRGRKRAEAQHPSLLADIRQIVEPDSQTDPTFETRHRYRRISAPSVREQLLEEYGYLETTCPQERTIRTKLNELDFRTRRVVKSKPEKKFPKPTRSLRNSTASTRLRTPHRGISGSH
jgi:hypothetical protein